MVREYAFPNGRTFLLDEADVAGLKARGIELREVEREVVRSETETPEDIQARLAAFGHADAEVVDKQGEGSRSAALSSDTAKTLVEDPAAEEADKAPTVEKQKAKH
jgi:hypothetical protein